MASLPQKEIAEFGGGVIGVLGSFASGARIRGKPLGPDSKKWFKGFLSMDKGVWGVFWVVGARI